MVPGPTYIQVSVTGFKWAREKKKRGRRKGGGESGGEKGRRGGNKNVIKICCIHVQNCHRTNYF